MKRVKKLIIYALIIFLNSLFLMQVNAASATLNISSKAKEFYKGNEYTFDIKISSSSKLGAWEFVVDYNTECLKFKKSTFGGANGGVMVSDTYDASHYYGKSYTITFEAKKACKETVISFVDVGAWDLNENAFSVSKNSLKFNIIDESSLSNDNNLKALSVSGYNISPSFDKNKTSYSLTVPNNVRQITVNATKSDSKAKVTGTGKVNLNEGLNKVNVVVTSERGYKKTYTINVTVQEKDPIKVEVGGEEHTIIRKRADLKAPQAYEETIVKINNEDIPAFHSDITGYNLVGLTDKNGVVNLYIYNDIDNTYTIYNEYSFSGIRIYPFTPKEENLFVGAKETEITIGEDTIIGYKIDGVKYPLVYALNVETGKENWYTFDSEEGTLQKYAEGKTPEEITEDVEPVTKGDANNDKYKNLSYILGGIAAILFVFLFVALIRLVPKKKIG